ncbi:DUF1573 domain-containing protein [Cytophaga aurantiaca]|uniref:DUF1573 domain-containing protein n=1 Tax=Cytophaga aurantiaca TaxID=29530 RepID=UPI000381F1C2|nr:DUF1573 domain-containing protein [Cytophaga aurantiaca]
MKRIVTYAFLLSCAVMTVSCDDKKNEEAAVAQLDSTGVPVVQELKTTSIAFNEAEHEFGDVKEGEFAKHEFVFKNTGTEPLYVRDAKASCGCTTPEWTKDTIAPGAEGKILVQFNSEGRPGNFTKTVTVLANTDPEATVITIKGFVIAKAKDISGPYIKDAN